MIGLKSKAVDQLRSTVLQAAGYFKSFGHVLQVVYADRESNLGAMRSVVLPEGIRVVQSAAGLHEKTSERYTRAIREGVRSTREHIRQDLGYEFPAPFNEYLVRDVVFGLNRSPNVKTIGRLPYTLVTGQLVDGSNLFPSFGTVGYFHNPNHKQNSFPDRRGELGLVIGHEDETGTIIGYLIEGGRHKLRGTILSLSASRVHVRESSSVL